MHMEAQAKETGRGCKMQTAAPPRQPGPQVGVGQGGNEVASRIRVGEQHRGRVADSKAHSSSDDHVARLVRLA
jgi:hypothetical protein